MKRGSNGFTDAAVVVLAILLFFRTADVLTYFAPPLLNSMVGTDVSWLYAIVMAFFVEGIALAFHFDPRAHKHTPAIIVKWTLLAISGLCQVFDGNIISGTIAQMSGPMKIGFQWGVPLLPIFVVVLLFFVGKLPDEDEERRSWLDRLQDKGIKSRLPDPRAIWEGRKENTEFSLGEVVETNIRQHNRPYDNDDIALAKSINPFAAPYRSCPKCGDAVPLTVKVCEVCGTEMSALPNPNGQEKATINPTSRQP